MKYLRLLYTSIQSWYIDYTHEYDALEGKCRTISAIQPLHVPMTHNSYHVRQSVQPRREITI